MTEPLRVDTYHAGGREVDIGDLQTLASSVIVNHRPVMRRIALLRHHHPKAASYSPTTIITVRASVADTKDPEAHTPPPAYADTTGEKSYTIDTGARAGSRYRQLINNAITALIDLEKFQADQLFSSNANVPEPADEIWCRNHIRYNHFEPRVDGRDGLCRWCWDIQRDYGALPTREAVDLKARPPYDVRMPKNVLDQAMAPPSPKTPTRTKKRRSKR